MKIPKLLRSITITQTQVYDPEKAKLSSTATYYIVKATVITVKLITNELMKKWDSVNQAVSKTRVAMEKLTNTLCIKAPCPVMKFVSFFAEVLALIFGLLKQLFKRTKESTWKIGQNEYHCPIWRKQVKEV